MWATHWATILERLKKDKVGNRESEQVGCHNGVNLIHNQAEILSDFAIIVKSLLDLGLLMSWMELMEGRAGFSVVLEPEPMVGRLN